MMLTPRKIKTRSRLKVALFGAGPIACDSHVQTLKRYPGVFRCIAVWAKQQKSAKFLVNKQFSDDTSRAAQPKIYSGEDGLKELFENTGVEAVIIALPLDVQHIYVRKALLRGKHVLSENPIATTLSKAQKLVDCYQKLVLPSSCPAVWFVAENYRYHPAILRAAQVVQKDIG